MRITVDTGNTANELAEGLDPSSNRLTGRYHPDVIIFLILIPIISGINYYLTYSNIRPN